MSLVSEDPLSSWVAVKEEGCNDKFSVSPSLTSVQDIIHRDLEEIPLGINPFRMCLYCGTHKKGDNRTVSIDTFDLDTFTRSSYAAYRTIAIDTSDLDIHYDFYKHELMKTSKSVATDTYDLLYKSDFELTSSGENTKNSNSKREMYRRQKNVCITVDQGNEGLMFSARNECDNTLNNVFIKSDLEFNSELPFESSFDETNNIVPSNHRFLLSTDNVNEFNVSINNNLNVKQDKLQISDKIIKEKENDFVEHDQDDGEDSDNNEGADHTSGDERGHFECNVCKAVFMCKQVLSDHLVAHVALESVLTNKQQVDSTPSTCNLCGKKFRLNRQHHCPTVRLKTQECQICKKCFRSEKTLHEHIRHFHSESKLDIVNNSQDMSKCSENISKQDKPSNESERRKSLINDENFEDSYKDDICNGKKVSLSNMDTKSSIKPKESINFKKKSHKTPIECLTCGKVFRCWSALKNHETVHTGERKFVCEVCSKAFPTKACLKSHGSTHTGLKPFVCPTCNKPFAHKDSLKTHIRTHTGERPFKCDLCDQAFNRSFTLNMHIRTHTGEKKHICSACGQAFTTNSALKCHERRKHSAFPPPKTHRVYKRRTRDPFICDVCGKVCTSSSNLRFHSANHTGIKPFACTICGKAYPMKQTLQRHMLKHTGERPFVCDVCGMAFYRSTTLNIHKFRHTGEKPNVCPLCGKGFIQSSSLSYHIRNHNRPPKPEPKSKRRQTCHSDTFEQGLPPSNYSEHLIVNGNCQQGMMPKPQTMCKLFIPPADPSHIHMAGIS